MSDAEQPRQGRDEFDPGQARDRARLAVELVARSAYGRLVAIIAKRTRDLASAEDALSDALAQALSQWPAQGVPESPEAWLLSVARRRAIDAQRRRQSALGGPSTDDASPAAEPRRTTAPGRGQEPTVPEDGAINDERLGLMFACAHPAIDAGVRPALMLQAALGLSVESMAGAFALAPGALMRRLTRAKAKIRDAGIDIAPPVVGDMAARLDDVLQAIYACFSTGYDDGPSGAMSPIDLSEHAMELSRTLCVLLPDEPEAMGLLALMLHIHARRDARRSGRGEFVPLSEQDPDLWDMPMLRAAERTLAQASAIGRMGPFQLEAAIQSAHASRAFGQAVPWTAVERLYAGLVAMRPTLGAIVGHAAAVMETRGALAALERLDAMIADDPAAFNAFQPYWAVRAEACERAGDRKGRAAALGRAITLCPNAAARRFLQRRAQADDARAE